ARETVAEALGEPGEVPPPRLRDTVARQPGDGPPRDRGRRGARVAEREGIVAAPPAGDAGPRQGASGRGGARRQPERMLAEGRRGRAWRAGAHAGGGVR